MNLSDLLSRHEGKSLEFKRDLSSPDPILRTLVAFANTDGGVLLLGVENKTRAIRGVSDPLAEEERLTNLIADHIEPRIIPNIELLAWRHTHVLGIEVFPSSIRPHHLKKRGPEDGVFVRVGSTNRQADASLIAEMRRFALNETFDEQPLPELNSEAVDFRVASELFASRRPLRQSDRSSLRLLTTIQNRRVPTVGGLLLFGATRERHFPDAWVQCGRFAGRDKSRILDQVEFHGALPTAALEAVGFVRKHARVEARIEDVIRSDEWTIPLVAVREAVVNAVVHADYSQSGAPIRVAIFDDRVEVENPGLLPFGVTVEDLACGVSKLRNRVVGRVFKELGLIEQWGSGIQRMCAACSEKGFPPPRFEEIGFRFRVTLMLLPVGTPRRDEANTKIVRILAEAERGRTHHRSDCRKGGLVFQDDSDAIECPASAGGGHRHGQERKRSPAYLPAFRQEVGQHDVLSSVVPARYEGNVVNPLMSTMRSASGRGDHAPGPGREVPPVRAGYDRAGNGIRHR